MIRVQAQPRGPGRCFLMTDISRGDSSWGRYRDAPVPDTYEAVECAALEEARAKIDRDRHVFA